MLTSWQWQRVLLLSALSVALAACAGPGAQAPRLTAPANVRVVMSESATFEVAVAAADPAMVALTVSSSNPALLGAAQVTITGAGAARAVQVAPTVGAKGSALLTFTATAAAGPPGTVRVEVLVAEPFAPTALTEPLPEPGNGLRFASAVALNGSYAAVNVYDPNDRGAGGASMSHVAIYHRGASGWSLAQVLTGSRSVHGDNFGRSLAMTAGALVVGADQDSAVAERAGAAYVFELIDGSWVETALLEDPDPQAQDSFGRSVATDGAHVVVGAQGDTVGGLRTGSAFVFEQVGGVWTYSERLGVPGAVGGEVFGESVALRGSTLAVGAYGSSAQQGAVHVYRLGLGGWRHVAALTAADGAAGDQLGARVAVAGDLVLGAAPNAARGGQPLGAVYVFEPSGNTYRPVDKLMPEALRAWDAFGQDLVADGDYLVAGAYGHDAGPDAMNSGAAYVFQLQGGAWVLTTTLLPATPETEARFGNDLALEGGRLLVGANGDLPPEVRLK